MITVLCDFPSFENLTDLFESHESLLLVDYKKSLFFIVFLFKCHDLSELFDLFPPVLSPLTSALGCLGDLSG